MLGRMTYCPTRWIAAAILLSLLLVASPVAAFAASGPWQSVDLTLIGAQTNSGVLLVTGHLAAGATLPAKVSLAVPPGAKIGWVGEILGGAASKDPTVKYSVTKAAGYDLVSFVLTDVRTGQVEAGEPSGYAPNGSANQAGFSWVAPYDIPTVNLGVQLPSGASVTGGTPGGKTVPSGSGLEHDLAVHKVAKGQNVQFAVNYTGGATTSAAAQSAVQPTGSTAGGSSGSRTPLIVLVVVGAIALFLAAMYFVLRYLSSPSSGGGSDEAK